MPRFFPYLQDSVHVACCDRPPLARPFSSAQLSPKLTSSSTRRTPPRSPCRLPGTGCLSSDGETLIVYPRKPLRSIYIDTSKEKEVKRVKVNFKPATLALRFVTFAVAKGTSLLYVLDAQTGQSKEQIRAPGDTLVRLACRPSAGPLFATNDQFEVLALEMGTSKLEKTEAKATSWPSPPRETSSTPAPQETDQGRSRTEPWAANSVNVGVAKTNINSTIVEYSLDPEKMEPVAMKGNAAIDGHGSCAPSAPTARRLPWSAPAACRVENGEHVYAIAVYDTSDLETQLGQVETGAYPAGMSASILCSTSVAEKFGGGRGLPAFDPGDSP